MSEVTTIQTWGDLRCREERKPYWGRLQEVLTEERSREEVLPVEDSVFAALEATPFDRVKVVMLGQDPYPTPGHAHGLAFSVLPGVEAPASLKNIHAELADDLDISTPDHGNLAHWAQQGVLLLNTTLTVRAGVRNSHARLGWWRFTNEVVRALGERPEETVFMLWGAPARRRARLVHDHHLVIESSHPSPLSAHRAGSGCGSFFGSRPFSRANEFLVSRGRSPVDWRLPDQA